MEGRFGGDDYWTREWCDQALRNRVGIGVDGEGMVAPGRFLGRIGENRKAHCRSLPSVGMTRGEG
jgi:hypothetical protein